MARKTSEKRSVALIEANIKMNLDLALRDERMIEQGKNVLMKKTLQKLMNSAEHYYNEVKVLVPQYEALKNYYATADAIHALVFQKLYMNKANLCDVITEITLMGFSECTAKRIVREVDDAIEAILAQKKEGESA